MAKTKISEFSATPGNNTDIDGINIAEGCAPSGINDAIRELMSQLKDFQTGAAGDSFNGPVGTTTAAAGAFTTLSASSTVSGTGFSTYLASPPAIGGTTAAAVSATTLTTSSTVTHNGGTANGVAYLNGSKVLTTGSALTFDGTNLSTTGRVIVSGSAGTSDISLGTYSGGAWLNTPSATVGYLAVGGSNAFRWDASNLVGYIGGSEQMRLTSTGLGIGTSSPSTQLQIAGSTFAIMRISAGAGDNNARVDFGTVASPDVGRIGYNNSTNGFTFRTNGSDVMTLDSSGSLGIGTSSPAKRLDVRQAYTADTVVAQIGNTNNGNGATPSATLFDFTVNNGTPVSRIGSVYTQAIGQAYLSFSTYSGGSLAEKMQLDASGNLGLGVTPSAWGSNWKAIQIGGGYEAFAANTRSFSLVNTYNDGTNWRYTGSGYATYYGQSSTTGAHSWHIAPSGTAGDAISFTQAMTLDASGNLLVGATSSTYSAAGRGVIEVNGSSNSLIAWKRNGSASAYLYATSSEFQVNNTEATPMTFYVNGSERARIASSGQLLVGTTNTLDGSTIQSWDGIAARASDNYNGGPNIRFFTGVDTTGGIYCDFQNSGGSRIGSISRSGASSVAYNTSSDYRLKENIQPMTGALAKVAALKPCTYKWKADGSEGEGFIAHELQAVVPQCVTGEKDAVDAEGKPVYQGIDTSFLVATLTAAIQEQQTIINQLKSRLDAANL